MWLAYAWGAIIIWSATAIADRHFLTCYVQSKRFYVLVPALLQFALVLAFSPFLPRPSAPADLALYAMLSGGSEALLLYYLFVAMSKEEISRVLPLTGLGPIITLLLGWLILGERLNAQQLIAFGLFSIGAFLLMARRDRNNDPLTPSPALKPVIVGSLISSLFVLLTRFAFTELDFWTALFYSRLGFFASGLVVYALSRDEVLAEWGSLPSKIRIFVIANQVIAFAGHALYFLAISLASAALVQSILSIQSVVVLILVLAFSHWQPHVIDERLDARTVLRKCAGVLLAMLATYVLTSH